MVVISAAQSKSCRTYRSKAYRLSVWSEYYAQLFIVLSKLASIEKACLIGKRACTDFCLWWTVLQARIQAQSSSFCWHLRPH